MPDPANIEKLQEDYALRHERGVKQAAVRSCLGYFEVPQPGDAHLTYGDLLRRMQAVIATELQHEGA